MKQKEKNSAIIIPEGCERVLLHSCCAPCSSAIVEWLLSHEIEPIIYYYNPNIYPLEEYEKRKTESQRHAASLGIQWLSDDESGEYSGNGHETWLHEVNGLEHEPERGRRCEQCFYIRLLAAARKAQACGIRYFATTLASSRWKNLDQVNAAGLRAAAKANEENALRGGGQSVVFWAQNWRKDGLQERRNQLLKEYQFYNQQYCGCEFSMRKEQ